MTEEQKIDEKYLTEVMELSTVETILATINTNIVEFYNFIKVFSNDDAGRKLLDELLKLKRDIKTHLYKHCTQAEEHHKSKAVIQEAFVKVRECVHEQSFYNVMDSLRVAFSDLFTYIIVADDSEDVLKLHDKSLNLIERIEKYAEPKIAQLRKKMAEDIEKKKVEEQKILEQEKAKGVPNVTKQA